MLAAFEDEYRRIYGLTIPDVGIEVVTWRLAVTADSATVEPDARSPPATGAEPHATPARRVRPRPATPSTRRCTDAAELAAGARFDGPAIIEERETTAVIRPGWSVEVAADGSVHRHAHEQRQDRHEREHTTSDVRPDRAGDPAGRA